MSDAQTMSVEDLEVSVRTMGLLMELGVETVGDLLALPSISAPKMVVAELTELFADLGVTYTGEWETPEAPAVVEATGSVTERWQMIEDWLEEHSPDALESFRPPATAEAMAHAEQQLGVSLPADYKELLARHDGQEDSGPMVEYCSLLPVGELAEKRKWVASLIDDWQPGWVPIGHFTRTYMVLDLTPAGKARIFLTAVDEDGHEDVASSCADLLGRYFRELQDGTIELE